MVPGSTLIYGSSLIKVTRKPRASSRAPIDEAARPLPKLETTPPVTKIYLGIAFSMRGVLCLFLNLKNVECYWYFVSHSSPLRPEDVRPPGPHRILAHHRNVLHEGLLALS